MLYGSDQVHVPTLNLADVSFGPAHAPVAGGYLPQDMNGDGYPDIVLFFSTAATGLAIGDTESCLEGGGAQPFRVCGPVAVTTGNCGLGFEAGLALLPLMLWRRRLRRAR